MIPTNAPRTDRSSGGILGEGAADLDRLRALLLADERVRRDENDVELRSAIADALKRDEFFDLLKRDLAAALVQAERANPKAVSRALAPAVVHSIRREIVNSRDDMVEALYPITGRLVRAAVADAFTGFIADINRRLEAVTSPSVLTAHLKAIIYRKPASTFLIADAVDALVLKRALLIDRQTGTPTYVWRDGTEGGEDAARDEALLVSSMFAAISAFAAEKYDAPGAELRTLDLNGRQVALRHSARHMLVVEHEGRVTQAAATHIDACFDDMLRDIADDHALALNPILTVPAAAARKRNRRGRLLATMILLGLVGLAARSIYDRWWFGERVETVNAFVAQNAANFAPVIAADRRGRTIAVRGAVPPGFDTTGLVRQLQADGVALSNHTVAVVDAQAMAEAMARIDAGIKSLSGAIDRAGMRQTSDARNASADIAALRNRLDAALADLGQRLDTVESAAGARLADAVDHSRTALDAIDRRLAELGQAQADTARTLAAMQQAAEAERRAAIDAIHTISIQFGQNNQPADPVVTAAQLSQVASLSHMFGLRLAIEGYGDESGTADTNNIVSSLRARSIRDALVGLGMKAGDIELDPRGKAADRDGKFLRQVRVRVLEPGG